MKKGKFTITNGTAWQEEIITDPRMPRKKGERAADYSVRWHNTFRGGTSKQNPPPNTKTWHNEQN